MPAAALLAAAVTAAASAAATRPWGLGALALVAYVPAFVALARLRRPLHGAIVAGVAAAGLNSVAYESAQGLFSGAFLAAVALATLPHLGVGALAVRVKDALGPRLGEAAAASASLLALPTLWVTAEWLPSRPELLGVYALPLGFIGYSQVDLPTGQLASLGSVSLVSHAVLAANACLALWLMWAPRWAGARCQPASVRPGSAAPLLPLSLALASLVVAGAVALPGPDEGRSGPGLGVTVVQPNLTDAAYFAASRSQAARAWLLERLLGALDGAAPADLIVLPEAAWPGPVTAASAASLTTTLAARVGASAVLFGAPAVGAVGGGRERTNSAFLFRDGSTVHAYAKRRLVPFGERGLEAGAGPVVVSVGGLAVAPLVCYDALFPSDVRAAVRAGAHALAVLTDDAFAAGSHVPELHLRAARMRAVESGVPVVLAANTGPSAFVDPTGRVSASLPPLVYGALSAELRAGSGVTPYVSAGEWHGGLNAFLACGVAALARGGRHRPRST